MNRFLRANIIRDQGEIDRIREEETTRRNLNSIAQNASVVSHTEGQALLTPDSINLTAAAPKIFVRNEIPKSFGSKYVNAYGTNVSRDDKVFEIESVFDTFTSGRCEIWVSTIRDENEEDAACLVGGSSHDACYYFYLDANGIVCCLGEVGVVDYLVDFCIEEYL